MTITIFPSPQIPRPAVRDELAAAGPVEPSSSPDMAPGPTLSPQGARADQFRRRRTSELVSQARHLYRRGDNYAGIARVVAVTPDTARRWLDPDYDLRRRRYAAVIGAYRPEDEADVPTLAFVPGVVITGRYRMKRPS
ncbi:hypothetical protein [Taklimakanibacter deserti]|uniref:hypothetical protein n=1 Tax=Taklimakanibacter deserti TaxID=2267839 RepID=UPI0013C4F5F7